MTTDKSYYNIPVLAEAALRKREMRGRIRAMRILKLYAFPAAWVAASLMFLPTMAGQSTPSTAGPALSAKVNGVKAAAGKWAIVMHGGAGVIERSSMTPEREKAYRAGLDEAIQAAA